MSSLQVKNIPERLHKRLRTHAKKRGCTISDVVLQAVERELERRDFIERLEKRRPVKLKTSAAALLEAERRE